MQLTFDVNPRDIMTEEFISKHVRVVRSKQEAAGLEKHLERAHAKRLEEPKERDARNFTNTVLFLNDRDLSTLVSELTAQNDAFNRLLKRLQQPDIEQASKTAMEQKIRAWNNQVTQRSLRATATDAQAPVPPYPQFVEVAPANNQDPIKLEGENFTTRCMLGYGFRTGNETEPYLKGRLVYGVAKECGVFKISHLERMIDS